MTAPNLQIRKMKLREVRCRTSKRWNWDENAGSAAPESILLTTLPMMTQKNN